LAFLLPTNVNQAVRLIPQKREPTLAIDPSYTEETKKEGVSGWVEGARKLPRDSRGTPSILSLKNLPA
jgi:hypothetical protein